MRPKNETLSRSSFCPSIAIAYIRTLLQHILMAPSSSSPSSTTKQAPTDSTTPRLCPRVETLEQYQVPLTKSIQEYLTAQYTRHYSSSSSHHASVSLSEEQSTANDNDNDDDHRSSHAQRLAQAHVQRYCQRLKVSR